MKPVMQTTVGPEGDCLPACIASILELPLGAVPHWNKEHGLAWFQALRRWLRECFGLDALIVHWEGVEGWLIDSEDHAIVTGNTPHGTLHSVVFRGAELAHDPAPEPIRFVGDPVDVMFFVKRL